MQRLALPGELPRTLLARLCSTIAQKLTTSCIVGEAIHLSNCSLVDPHLVCHWMVKQLGEVSASLTSDGRHRLHIQRECYRAYLDEEMSLQQKRREMHKSRPIVCGHLENGVGFWRSRAHLHRRTKASRQFKEGAFLGPARVLLQERERKGDDLKYKAVVWLVDGDQLVRCSSTHLRPVSTAEQTLCSLRDGEARTFSTLGAGTSKEKFRGSCWTVFTS